MKKQGIDAVLDEVDEARREIMAEHGNDWRKVLESYLEMDRQSREGAVDAPRPGTQPRSAA